MKTSGNAIVIMSCRGLDHLFKTDTVYVTNVEESETTIQYLIINSDISDGMNSHLSTVNI